MKKLLLTSFITLISFNLSALEHVIGISGGYSFSTSKEVHIMKTKKKHVPDTVSDTTSTFTKEKINKNIGYNFDIEYQLRFNVFNNERINNFFVLGIGYKNEQISFKSNYRDFSNLNTTINNPYLLAMVTPLDVKDLKLRGGFTVGYGINKLDNYNFNKITADIIFDAEYNISSNFILFSRLNINIISGKDVSYDTKLLIEKIKEDTKIVENYINMQPKEQLYRLNFGIRYKI